MPPSTCHLGWPLACLCRHRKMLITVSISISPFFIRSPMRLTKSPYPPLSPIHPPKTITPVNCSSRFPLPSHHYQIINHAINEITISTIAADTQHTIIVVNPLLLLKACVCAELDGFGWQEKSHHRHHHPENSFSSSPQFQKRIASR